MMLVQGECALVIQNRAAKIARAKISISQIVKQICVPLTCANQRLVTGDRFLEMTLRVFLVRFCEFNVWLGMNERCRCETQEAKDGKHPLTRQPERSRGIPW